MKRPASDLSLLYTILIIVHIGRTCPIVNKLNDSNEGLERKEVIFVCLCMHRYVWIYIFYSQYLGRKV